MKITYIVPSLAPKGPTYQLLNLIANMQNEHVVQLYVLSNPRDETSKLFTELNIVTKYIPVRGVLSFYRARELISKSFADIYHSHGVKADLMNAFVNNASSASIATIRNIPWKDYPARWRVLGWFVCIFHCLILMRLVTVACSTWMLNPLKRLKCQYAINNATNDIFNIDVDRKFNHEFFYVGSLNKRKNVQLCIYILERLQSVKSLDLYGTGKEELTSKTTLVNRHGQCTKRSVDAANKIFISMSMSEGLPNAVLEALNSGCFCVLSDIPAHNVLKDLFPRNVHIFKRTEMLEEWLKTIEGDLTFANQRARSVINSQINSTKYMSDKYLEIYERHKI